MPGHMKKQTKQNKTKKKPEQWKTKPGIGAFHTYRIYRNTDMPGHIKKIKKTYLNNEKQKPETGAMAIHPDFISYM